MMVLKQKHNKKYDLYRVNINFWLYNLQGIVMNPSCCVVCDKPISPDTDSDEHIINNAIGGRKKTTGFICKDDNNMAGRTWDAELASQLNDLCHLFAIQRERGEIPEEVVTTTADEKFVMLSNGGFKLLKPVYEKKQEGTTTQIQAQARNKREARQMLQGLKRRYPSIDVETELAKGTEEILFPKGMINIPVQIGGVRSGRSIVKSAMAFAHECGVPAKTCEEALAYLRDEKVPACFGYYQSSDLVVERPQGVPFHCVAISGDPKRGLLLGYVEYFGFLRIVVCLSRAYAGAPIERCHAINPTTGQELHLSVRMSFTEGDIADIFKYKHCSHDDTARNLQKVVEPAIARKVERDCQKWITDAINYAFEKSGMRMGERLRPEQAENFSRLLAKRMALYITNLNQPRPVPLGATLYPLRSAKDKDNAS
jgi:hypothetical protein